MDREKVIKGLECHAEFNCVECPYRDGGRTSPCGEAIFTDAIALLKKQEAKTPVEYEHNGYWYNICPTCGNRDEELLRQWNYCPFCGQKVEWDG